ncbi:hypothetical protein M0R19_07485 [Candidatus Pacearchaeota archaeon]|nr:hypothetical protein [Candidatus Pacearchaeota archaeon]
MKLLDIERYSEKLIEVTSSKVLKTQNMFHSQGIFSEQIFGPIRDYTCQCRIKNTTDVNKVCPTCGVKYASSIIRRRSVATIKLPCNVLHPMIYLSMKQKTDRFNKMMGRILTGYTFYEIVDGKFVEKPCDEEMKIDDLYKLIEEMAKIFVPEIYEVMMNKFGNIFTKNVLVIPPDLRPVVVTNKELAMDSLNYIYQHILIKKEQYNKFIQPESTKIFNYDFVLGLWYDVYSAYEHCGEYINGDKDKLMRNNLLGKRIDFSGRSTIVVDPTLGLDQAGISDKLLVPLFKPELINALLEKRICVTSQEANELLEKHISDQTNLHDFIKKTCDNKIIILNRQPTLHRMGMFAFKVVTKNTLAIHINPLICAPYNADFDGDQMAVYRPLTNDATVECIDKMLPSKNLLSVSDTNFNFSPSQSMVYGVYILTQSDKEYDFNEECEHEGIKTTKGRVEFNKIFPKDYPFINEAMDRKKIKNILYDLSMKYDSETVADICGKIKDMGFEYSTYYPVDVNLDNFVIPEITNEFKEKEIFNSDNPSVNIGNEERYVNSIKEKFKLSKLIKSSARGDWLQAKQIFCSRGHVSDYKGNFIKTPITHSLIDGLTSYEHFLSCYGTRKGLIDTAENTAKAGYLTRQLIYAMSSIELDYNNEDCGSTEGVQIVITPKILNHLYGRYIVDEDKKSRLVCKDDIGKTVILRSPIRCKGKDICKTCYGKLSDIARSRYVGFISAQAIGEINTQHVLRTFHISGAAIVKDGSKTQEDIVTDMKRVNDALSGKCDDYREMLEILMKVYGSYSNIQMIHVELLISQLLWSYVDNKITQWRKLESSVEYKPVSKIVCIGLQSPLLAFAFSPGRTNFYEILRNPNYNNILLKFMFNRFENIDGKGGI